MRNDKDKTTNIEPHLSVDHDEFLSQFSNFFTVSDLWFQSCKNIHETLIGDKDLTKLFKHVNFNW